MGCCSVDGCSCLIVAGSNVTVSGSGTPTNPWLIDVDIPPFTDLIRVEDTQTVNLTLFGSGTEADKFVLRAAATLKVTDLLDVVDPQGGPLVGETLVWVGGASPHFEFTTLPPAPAGAVNVSQGIGGVGSVGDPIKLLVSGTWGSGSLTGLGGDSTIGQPVYIDSAGQARVKPIPATTVAWADVTGKPNVSLVGHTHVVTDITDLTTNGDVAKIDGKRIKTTANSSTPPSVGPLGLWFYPEGT